MKNALKIIALAVFLLTVGICNAREIHADDSLTFMDESSQITYCRDAHTDVLVTATGVDGGVEVIQYDGTDYAVTIPEFVQHAGKTYQTVRIGDEAFSPYGGGTYVAIDEISLPDSIREIGEMAFSDCGLDSIDLPKKLGEIGRYAFAGNSLHVVVLPDEGHLNIGTGAFQGCPLTYVVSHRKGNDPYNVLYIESCAFGYDENGVISQDPPVFNAYTDSPLAVYAERNGMPIFYYHTFEVRIVDEEGNWEHASVMDFGKTEKFLNQAAAAEHRRKIEVINRSKASCRVFYEGQGGYFNFYKTQPDGWELGADDWMEIVVTPPYGVEGIFTETLHFISDCGNDATNYYQYYGEDLGEITVRIELGEHEHVFGGEWLTDRDRHFKQCQVNGCNEYGMFGDHDADIVVGRVEPTFDTDGYSGDHYCSVCNKKVATGHLLAAGKYIRESYAQMSPDPIIPGMTPGDIAFTSGDPDKYSVRLFRCFD